MISIREEVEELERTEKIRKQATACYISGIQNSAEYAIEFEEEVTARYRQHLRSLAASVAEGSLEVIEESRSTFRNLLRDYRDKASRHLNTIREELSGSTQALVEIMESLSHADGESERKLQACLGRLREASGISDVKALRALALDAADSIQSNVEQMRKHHELTVSQFQVEIRVLHHRIDALERAASVDALTELLRRPEIEQKIRNGSPGHCLLMIRAGGFHLVASRFHPDVATELAGAFSKRLRNSLPPGTEIGRWSEDGFVAIIPADKTEAAKKARWISEHLSGGYACLLDGKTVRPALQVSVAILESNPGTERQTLARVSEFLSAK